MLELETTWSLSEVLDANDFLDAIAEAEEELHERLNPRP